MTDTQIKDGKVKALGVTSLKSSPVLPDVATLDYLTADLSFHEAVLQATHNQFIAGIVARDERGAERTTAKLIEAARADIESGVAADAGFLLGAPA